MGFSLRRHVAQCLGTEPPDSDCPAQGEAWADVCGMHHWFNQSNKHTEEQPRTTDDASVPTDEWTGRKTAPGFSEIF